MKKTLFLFGLYIGIVLLNSCLKCSDDYPYYDFHDLDFYLEKDVVFNDDSVYVLSLIESEIDYLADGRGSFISSSFATEKCPSPGHSGKKYKVLAMSMTSNHDWDDDHPTGSNLISLIKFILPVFNTETGLDEDGLFGVEENHKCF